MSKRDTRLDFHRREQQDEDVLFLVDMGEHPGNIAKRLGITEDYVREIVRHRGG